MQLLLLIWSRYNSPNRANNGQICVQKFAEKNMPLMWKFQQNNDPNSAVGIRKRPLSMKKVI